MTSLYMNCLKKGLSILGLIAKIIFPVGKVIYHARYKFRECPKIKIMKIQGLHLIKNIYKTIFLKF